MDLGDFSFLYNDELTVLRLRKLYESCGFGKFSVSRFESYDFYARNKDFLIGKSIISFSDLSGRLMALKPDVTLSIVKNAGSCAQRQKLYYTENVYRESKQTHELKEIFQVGLEVIGDIDLFQTYETVSLAADSLDLISGENVLTLSHMGYIQGLADCITEDKNLRSAVTELISGKNVHDLMLLANEHSLPQSPLAVAAELIEQGDGGEKAIELAKKHALNKKMLDAANEIGALYELLRQSGREKKISVDFTVAGDAGYYNGILMLGYINGVAQNVLSGGRYDMLMSKMGKKNTGAMGFAIYFDALERRLHTRSEQPLATVVCSCDAQASAAAELTAELSRSGRAYRVVKKLPENASGTVFTLEDGKVREEQL